MKKFVPFAKMSGLIVAGFVALGSTTQAAFTVMATAGGSALAGVNYATFNAAPLGSTSFTDGGVTASFAGTGAAVVVGSVMNQFAAPVFVGANNMFFANPVTTGTDTTNYLSTGTGTVTLTFGGVAENYLGLVWGSVDSYNTLTFFDANGNVVGSVGGSQVTAQAGIASGTYVNITSTTSFTRVVASSGLNSFEIDNVAYGNTLVPEPSSAVLCGLAGLIGLGVARVRRKKAAV